MRKRDSLVLIAFLLGACATTSSTHSKRAPASSETPRARGSVTYNSASPARTETPEEPGRIKRQVIPSGNAAPQTLSVNLDIVSREMGVPRGRLEQQGRLLASRIEGRSVRTPCANEDDEATEKLCAILDRFTATRTPSSTFSRSSGGHRVPVRPQHFQTQQNMGYSRLVKSLGREPVARVVSWVPKLLATTSCPRNLSAAAIRRIETGLPAASVGEAMERLYEHAAACLQPSDDGYEATHFRQALLRQLWGNPDAARASINRAVLAVNSDEKSRVLYWAGTMAKDEETRTRHWDRLVDDYPLSFHALEVWRQRDLDPHSIFTERDAVSLSRKTVSQDDQVQEAMHWLETLYILGRVEAAQKFARWMSREYKDDLTPSNLLYISALKSRRGTPLNSITFLTRQIAENPEILNQQTLRMLFPKPYFDVFERASPNTDTFLILSVARQESGFNPRARSRANARGLLQLLPTTARHVSGKRKNDLYNTEVNAQLGVKFLSRLIEQFGSVEYALAAYNAGPGRIPEWRGRYPTQDMALFLDLIPFRETRGYVTSILRNNYWYERIYGNDPGVIAMMSDKKGSQRSQVVSRLVSAHERSASRAPAATPTDSEEL